MPVFKVELLAGEDNAGFYARFLEFLQVIKSSPEGGILVTAEGDRMPIFACK